MEIEEFINDVFEQIKDLFVDEINFDDVEQSMEEACSFFYISEPLEIREGDTTGVILKDKSLLSDDILSFSKGQMKDMGIDTKDGLDLVMTHECTHRILQTMKTGYDSWDEELCCDFMAGVRAGLNDIDTTEFTTSLQETEGSDTHPDGELRVEAVNEGIYYAKKCIEEDFSPSFADCLAHFSIDHENTELSDDNYSNEIKSFIDDRAYHQSKANEAKGWEEWHIKKGNEANDRGDLSEAKDHYAIAKQYHKTMKEELDIAKKCTK